jgi:acyl-CoA dehydrogenase
MTDQQRLIADLADSVFGTLGPGARFESEWPEIEKSGLVTLLVPEAAGGFGGSWDEALIVFRLAGRHGLALPLVEAVLAAAGTRGEPGIGSLATRVQGDLVNNRFTGTLNAVPWGRYADFVLVAFDGRCLLLNAPDHVEQGENLAGEPRDFLIYAAADVREVAADPALLAFGRVCQIAGALEAALERSVAYANDRVQFGRPLGKFQAVQQALASMAGEVAAVNSAAMGVAFAAARGDYRFELAAAKMRANMAIGIATSVAHQVHGAIGFTMEHDLHPLTRRLWSWRSEEGSDAAWAQQIGRRIAERGADHFWRDLVTRSDPEEN